MVNERREAGAPINIPEMPRRRHIPALVEWFAGQDEASIVEARDKLLEAATTRGVKPKVSQSLFEKASLAAWLHRNERRITGEPYIVHSLEVTTMTIRHPAISIDLIPRVATGLLLHDAIENNKNVSLLALVPHSGLKTTKDIYTYSRKSARDKSKGRDTEKSPEAYLNKFLKAREHLRFGKAYDRIHNMDSIPPGANKMIDKYFRKEADIMIDIIRSLGEKGRGLYDIYKEVFDRNKPADVPELPPFDKDKK